MRFKDGDKVRFTGAYLHDTGQMIGVEGFKRFTVMACGCKACRRMPDKIVAVDEPHAEIPDRWRHIATVCLERA